MSASSCRPTLQQMNANRRSCGDSTKIRRRACLGLLPRVIDPLPDEMITLIFIEQEIFGCGEFTKQLPHLDRLICPDGNS